MIKKLIMNMNKKRGVKNTSFNDVTSIEITGNTSLKKGTENQFTAIIKDKEGNVISDKVIWEISVDLNTVSFLKQENNAWITPKKAGTFTVTASCGDILETIICTVEE